MCVLHSQNGLDWVYLFVYFLKLVLARMYINAIRFCLSLLCTESRDVQIELSTVMMYCEEKLVSEILIYIKSCMFGGSLGSL